MARSLFALSFFPHRGILTIVGLALIPAALVYSQAIVRTDARQPLEAVIKPVKAPAATPAEIFIDLAATVGQDAPAKRLLTQKLKIDSRSQPRYWAIVDFSRPSTTKRFYVFDTVERKVETYYVAHGRGSEGPSDDGMAEVFSNDSGSLSSSLGIYRTLDVYNGVHGRSLRLEGLEPTNSNALARGIVLHTADYVSEAFIRQTGRLGRSEGCFAVERSVGDTLIDQLNNGAYIIASK